MSTPFFRLPVPVIDVTAPSVSADAGPIFPPALETDALAHWQFGVDESCLYDKINNHFLTPNGTPPTFDEFHLITVAGGYNGLLTPFDDSDAITVLAVLEYQELDTDKSMVVFGSSLTTGANGGEMGWLTGRSDSVYNTTTYQSRPGLNLVRTTGMNFGLTAGEHYAQIWARDNVDSRYMYSPGRAADGGLELMEIAAETKTIASPMKKISVGPVHYATTDFQESLKISELIIYDHRKTPEEALEIAKRSRVRAKYRGLTVNLGDN